MSPNDTNTLCVTNNNSVDYKQII